MKITLSLVVPLLFIQLNNVISFKLTILHTNDIHSRFEEINAYDELCSSKKNRTQEPNAILLEAGDVFTGTLWYNVYRSRGNATWPLMNELRYDAMTPLATSTEQFLRNVNFTVISVQTLCTLCQESKYQPLRDTTVYNVILDSYIANGNGGFTVKNKILLSYQLRTCRDHDVLAEYIKTHGPGCIEVHGRIQFVGSARTESKRTPISKILKIMETVVIMIMQLLFLHK